MLAGYYQKKKKKLQKRFMKGSKIFQKKIKGRNMVVNNIAIFFEEKGKRCQYH